PDARCRLEARLYEKGKDVKRDVKSTREVTWKLFRRDGSPAAPVTEGTGAAWSVTDLAPGSYRIAAAWGPKPGAPDDKSGGSGEETFTLHAGDTARADFVLSKFPTWAWIVLGVVVVGIIVGAIAMVSFAHALEGVSLFGSNAVPDGAPERSPSVEEPAAELPAE
ncbi:MAG TPA: hypothetical protein PK598_14360, partial [Thermoanaerobaculia bacterium]|nr:hypothetical protein [Thermoanaerobaculia bacterium]